MSKTFRSFRDPSGSLLRHNGRILRIINKEAEEEIRKLIASSILNKLMETKKIVKSHIIDKKKDNIDYSCFGIDLDVSLVVEHEPIFFPSYSYEWAGEMLYSAGELTLDLAENLLVDGKGIKDATPYNVLFDGPVPTFVDLTSIENRRDRDPIWLPYGQFSRMFLLPLLLNKKLNMPLSDLFFSRLDGIDIEETRGYLKGFSLLNPLTFFLVYLPYLLSKKSRKNRKQELYRERLVKRPDLAKFILSSFFKRNKKVLKKLRPKNPSKSKWLNYMEEKSHYSSDIFVSKETFVSASLDELTPKTVLDIGCNTGYFSILASDKKAKVVAIDYDASSIGSLWKRAKEEKRDILPLVVNICRPSPSVGWDNKECLSFLDRAKNKFEMVFMLAVIHHMIVTDRIPMDEISSLISKVTSKYLIIEFVEPEDQMFKVLVRGRDDLYKHITVENFIKSFEQNFKILKQKRLSGSFRTMFLMKKKNI